MIITSDKIREELRKIWPDLNFIVLSDSKWNSPSLQDAQSWSKRIYKPKFIKNLFECEELALYFMITQRAIAAKEYIEGISSQYNCSLGVAFGNKYHGKQLDHVVNIWLIENKGLMFMDYQTGEFWIPNSVNDNVYFVMM
jgi:hypothetical protein